MGGSRTEELYRLRKLAGELKHAEHLQSQIDALNKQIENEKLRAAFGVKDAEEKVTSEFYKQNIHRDSTRNRVAKVVFVLLLLAVSLLSFYVLLPAVQASSYIAEGQVFLCVFHGIVCLVVMILSVVMANKIAW